MGAVPAAAGGLPVVELVAVAVIDEEEIWNDAHPIFPKKKCNKDR